MTEPDTTQHFASDNYATVHPEVMAAMASANVAHDVAYGADAVTRAFDTAVAATWGPDAMGFPVFNGTGANVLSLLAVSPRWGGVVASEHAHINSDEGGAPERMGALKVLTLPSADGRLRPEQLARYAGDLGDIHRAQPLVLQVTQSTELGTVYGLDELRALTDAAHELGMRVHLDGARIANAAAALGVSLAEASAGADIVSFGGTKNGAMLGEAVVVVAPDLVDRLAVEIPYLRKSTMQLGSKMRFISAQLATLLTSRDEAGDALWLRNARHANAMAARLRAALAPAASRGDLRFTQETEANAIFAVLPRAAAEAVRTSYRFYDWQPGSAPDEVEVRWMCAWDTAPESVDAFAAAVDAALTGVR